jgi:hypothetical protein
MAITGNAKKKLVKNMVDSLWRKLLKRHTINLLPLHQSKTLRTKIRRNNSLCVNPACPLTIPIRECQTWATSSVRMVNSLPLNDPVSSPTISAFSVEV